MPIVSHLESAHQKVVVELKIKVSSLGCIELCRKVSVVCARSFRPFIIFLTRRPVVAADVFRRIGIYSPDLENIDAAVPSRHANTD